MTVISLVKEEEISYIDHDRLFKELIQTFFKEFVEVFFPNHYRHIDFTHLKFLEQEVFTDILKERNERLILLQKQN